MKKYKRRVVRRSARSKKDTRSEVEVFEEQAKLNPRLTRARTDAVDAVSFYSARVAEILGQPTPGQAIRRDTLFDQLGLAPLPRSGCSRSVCEEVIANEQQWCQTALSGLEEADAIVIFHKGAHAHVRLATDQDRTRWQREQAEDEKRKAEAARVREALGRNPAYVSERMGTVRRRNAGPQVTFAGPAYRKLVKLLEREGLLKNP